MIAQIILDSKLFIPREEAVVLGLEFTGISPAFGTLRAGSDPVKIPNTSERFVDQAFFNSEDGYYYKTAELNSNDKLNDYYLLDRIPEHRLSWVLCDTEQLVDLIKFAPICKVPYRIKKCVQQDAEQSVDNISSILYSLDKKIKTLSTLLDAKNSFNERCDVHIGGNTLTSYNEVKLCEDCCTDHLQAQLSFGWRMIMVCPQKDQRRPDYVLGRWNPELDAPTRAKRTHN